ncbi:ARL14 effector protein [Frankliniella fusca]|uniref:ARL14 effector protein n=1 Tax=Frankliniella fusca TaxID=407009 RepID=A0AAE1LI40_9NEOP|nr:ARL14 effector protein [Frankliniella fusca]
MLSRKDPSCSIGSFTKDECDKGPFSNNSSLSEKNAELIRLRSGCNNILTVCHKHQEKYLDKFLLHAGRKCSNPLNTNHTRPGSDIKEITWTLYSKWKDIEDITLIPGRKVCRECRDNLNDLLSGRAIRHDMRSKEEILEAIYGVQLLPEQDEDQLMPAPGPSTPKPSPSKAKTPLQSPQVTRLLQEHRTSPASSSGSASSQEQSDSQEQSESQSSKSSSQDFWSVPEDDKDYKTLYSIAELLGVGLPKLSELKTKAKLLIKELELYKALKALVLKVSKTSAKFTEEENPIKVPIDYEDTCIEIFSQIKEKLQESKKHEERIQILSFVPKSWPWSHIKNEFEVGRKTAEKVIKLVQEQGVLPVVNQRIGKPLNETTALEVKKFYLRPDISRELPGMKDFKSVKEDGKRVRKQKRLFLSTLKEGYEFYKEVCPEHPVGFSTFAELRPKEVILAGASGTHSVCVCLIHQNMILMVAGARLDNLQDIQYQDKTMENLDYKMLLQKIHCPEPTENCHLQKCDTCPGPGSLRPLLTYIFQERFVEKIEFKQWTTTDRSQLITQIQETEEFIDRLLESLPDLSVHSYIAKQQSKYYQEKKSSLQPGEVLVVGDFSENYSFTMQDEVPGHHWSKDQVTVHPFVSYYKPSQDSETVTKSVIILSDDLKHNTGAVFAFQKELLRFLQNDLKINVTRVIYFSDGCAGQYKNKFNVANLLRHKDDFGMDAEWHFFATSHGKGPSDGVGGAFKRQAANASLRVVNTGAQAVMHIDINTPEQLYEWGKKTMKESAVLFVNKDSVEETRQSLADRFSKAAALPNIRKQHCLVPMGEHILSIARTSYGSDYDIVDLNPSLKKKRKRNKQAKNLKK